MTTETDSKTADGGAGAAVGDAAKGDGGGIIGSAAAAAATKVDEKAAEQTGADGKAAEIELKLPKEFRADEKSLGEFKAIAKELKLDSAGAQKVFDVYAKTAQAQRAAEITAADQAQKAWEKSLAEDKDFGGAKLDANKQAIGNLLKTYDVDQAAAKVFAASGLGSHPDIVMFLHRIAQAHAEDSLSGSKNGGEAKPNTNREAGLRKLFPNSARMSFTD